MANVNIDREVSSEGIVWSLAEFGGVCMCYSNNKGSCENEASID